MVKMEIINESEEKISILLKETDRAFVNALRRSLMSDTPKMAIETVRFQMGTFDVCLSCGHRNGAAIAREASGGSGCDNCGKKLDKEGVDYTVWETNGPLPDERAAPRDGPDSNQPRRIPLRSELSNLQGFGSRGPWLHDLQYDLHLHCLRQQGR